MVHAVMKEISLNVELDPVAGRKPDGSTDAVQRGDFASNLIGRFGDGIKRL
jgi:hypothetical protein